MKLVINIWCIISFCNGFSQERFPAEPHNYKKIHFIYEKKSNIYYDEKGFYADTMFYKIKFPNLSFRKTTHPAEQYLCGFVLFTELDAESKEKMLSILYHSNESYVGTYDLETNKTIIKAERNDSEIKSLYEKLSKETYGRFRYTIFIDYEKKTKKTSYPAITHRKSFSEIIKSIQWLSDFEGSFKEVRNDVILTNYVNTNSNLPKVITLGYIFENNNFGINKVRTFYETIQLKSVSYE
ncbi:hypothetical protein [Flavobacterium sedimenticola]|uniref:Uncharacterized protein n=1 Tax=Flavobacterium sedimenticola TaxID=3043286 RepID=A0ABT6XLT8_9FLAO|nr:hypothetical protein [Flavobacterium sedimenticola]MDI9256049.1 hypothetical protein [Flavobacterium sedimenticola]